MRDKSLHHCSSPDLGLEPSSRRTQKLVKKEDGPLIGHDPNSRCSRENCCLSHSREEKKQHEEKVGPCTCEVWRQHIRVAGRTL